MRKLLSNFSKKINSVILSITFLIVPFFNILEVKAAVVNVYTINDSSVHFRETADSNSAELPVAGFHFPNGANVTYIGSVAAGNGCDDPWFNVSYLYEGNTFTGYVCSTYVNVTSYDNGNRVPANEYEQYLKDQGFPVSYWDKLSALHSSHPNWLFRAQLTGLNWGDVISAESDLPSNIYNAYSRIDGRPVGGNVGYRSTDSRVYNWATDTWIPLESGVFYAANRQTVEYYMDPRNFLDANHVFMFETLSDDIINAIGSDQIGNVLKVILPTGNYYNLDDYANDFITAGSTYKVSPVLLASRVKQEGAYNTKSASGQSISCTSSALKSDLYYGNGYWFSGTGYYNLFNIRATGDDVTCTAVAWASNGYNYTTGIFLGDGSYGRPWNTIPKAINGGAQFLAEGYIGIGQNTLYSQKFDIVGPSYFNHQYMTNIQAPYSEGYSSYRGYIDAGIIPTSNDNSTFIFNIPVYSTMPEVTSLPVNANPNSYLNSLTIDGKNVTGFAYDKTSYNLIVSSLTNTIEINATPVNVSANITGTGTIALPTTNNTINVLVKAANGVNQTNYTINVTKSDAVPISISSVISNMKLALSNNYISGMAFGTSASALASSASGTSPLVSAVVKDPNGNVVTDGKVTTGYTITINNSQDISTYTIVGRGDTNGDTAIDIKDLLIVQKHLLKSKTLSDAYYQGADINKDGSVDIKDLLLVQKHLLGVSSITQ